MNDVTAADDAGDEVLVLETAVLEIEDCRMWTEKELDISILPLEPELDAEIGLVLEREDVEVSITEPCDDKCEEDNRLVWEPTDVLSNPLVVNEVDDVSEARELEVDVDVPKGLYVWGVTEIGTYGGSSTIV